MIGMLMQAAGEAVTYGWWERLQVFIDSPAPFSPFGEYLLLLFVMWLIARRARRRPQTFDVQAQEVLDQKYADGELSQKGYEKFRQKMALRPKR
jgi:hypothetical protein